MIHSTNGFLETLPRGPLRAQIGHVHAIALHLYSQTDPTNVVAIEALEHSLREMAIYTAEPPEYRIPERVAWENKVYDASLLTPTYEQVGRFDPGEMQRAIKRASEHLSAGIRRTQASLRESRQTDEQREARSRRRYERQCDEQRAAAKMHLRNEVRRVRAELGLPEKTSPTKRGQ